MKALTKFVVIVVVSWMIDSGTVCGQAPGGAAVPPPPIPVQEPPGMPAGPPPGLPAGPPPPSITIGANAAVQAPRQPIRSSLRRIRNRIRSIFHPQAS